jgi:hypothetical protein
LRAGEINVIPFELVVHNHALGTLDALAGFFLAKDRSLSWCDRTRGGLDVGDPAVVADHKFVGLAAVVGNPESGTDAPFRRTLWHVVRDVKPGVGVEGSAKSQLSVGFGKNGGKCEPEIGGENGQIREIYLVEVALVGDGKDVTSCIWYMIIRRSSAQNNECLCTILGFCVHVRVDDAFDRPSVQIGASSHATDHELLYSK